MDETGKRNVPSYISCYCASEINHFFHTWTLSSNCGFPPLALPSSTGFSGSVLWVNAQIRAVQCYSLLGAEVRAPVCLFQKQAGPQLAHTFGTQAAFLLATFTSSLQMMEESHKQLFLLTPATEFLLFPGVQAPISQPSQRFFFFFFSFFPR
jgi:hypothetical protein